MLIFFLLYPGIYQLLSQDYLLNTRYFTVADGLSHNQVFCFEKDKDGFMWIGTKYGLNRFDAHDFKWFTKEENGLSSDIISAIYKDEEGRFWLVYFENQFGKLAYHSIDIFSPETFEVISFNKLFVHAPFSVSDLKSINRFSNGRLIFKLQNGEFYSYSIKEAFKRLPFNPEFKILNLFEDEFVWMTNGVNLLKMNLAGQIVRTIPVKKGYEITQLY